MAGRTERGKGCTEAEIRHAIETGEGLRKHAALRMNVSDDWVIHPMPQRDGKLPPGPARGVVIGPPRHKNGYVGFDPLLIDGCKDYKIIEFRSKGFSLLDSGYVVSVSAAGVVLLVDELGNTSEYSAQGTCEKTAASNACEGPEGLAC